MRSRIFDREETRELECAGRLTIRNRKSIGRLSDSINNSGRSQVVIDLSKLNYICSTDLGILLSLREGVMESGKRIVISGAADSLCEMLDGAACGSLFDIR